jgi:hypothetical protein
MSRSNQFTTRPARYRKPAIEDLQYRELHWTEQLQIRPLRLQVRKEYEQGDSSMYFDMDRDPNISNDKEQ